jgi:hypothetical protein
MTPHIRSAMSEQEFAQDYMLCSIVGAGTAILASGALSAGSSLLGGGKASSAAKDAANTQKQMYLQTRADLSPFTQAGAGVLPGLNALAMSGPTGGGPDYVSQAAGERPLQMTQANLEATPGYQFDLSQGLKATQSAAAARGLGVSGAALKGAATYATGLANKTYMDQFNLQQQRFTDLLNLNTGQQGQLQNQYARLHDTAALGANAAAQLGTQGTAAASATGNYLNAAGVDQANALTNATNALSRGVNNYLGYQNFQKYNNPTAGGPTSGYGTAAAGTPGISASGNPVMTGFAAPIVPGQVLPGGYTG